MNLKPAFEQLEKNHGIILVICLHNYPNDNISCRIRIHKLELIQEWVFDFCLTDYLAFGSSNYRISTNKLEDFEHILSEMLNSNNSCSIKYESIDHPFECMNVLQKRLEAYFTPVLN